MVQKEKAIKIPHDAKFCPDCGTELTIVRCPYHRVCRVCTKCGESLRVVGFY